MMSYKRLIPCIFIAGGKAVKWFDDDTVMTDDVVGLAKYYSDHGADELLVFDLSDSDEEHDEANRPDEADEPHDTDSHGCRRKYQKAGRY